MTEVSTFNAWQKLILEQNLNAHILAISSEDTRHLKRFIQKEDILYPILHDPQETIHDLYDIKAFPTLIWMDENQNIQDMSYGKTLFLFWRLKQWSKKKIKK